MEKSRVGNFAFSAAGVSLSCLPSSVTMVRGDREVTEPVCDTVRRHKLSHLPGFTVQASYCNYGREPVRLRRFNLIDAALELKGSLAEWRFFPIGTLGRKAFTLADEVLSSYETVRRMWRGFNLEPPKLYPHPRYDDPRWRDATDVAGVYRENGDGLLVGAIGPGCAFAELSVLVDDQVVRLLATAEMDDVLLEPGESRLSEEVVVLALPGSQAMENWVSMVAASHGSRTYRPPVTGWCSWYNDKGKEVDAGDIKGVIEAVNQDPERLRLEVIQVDDGYQQTVGDWRANQKFPAGMAALAEEINATGAMPGLWLAPLVAHESTDIFKKHQDWFQRDADGERVGYPMTCWGGNSYLLDPTHPEVMAFIRTVVKDAVNAGYTYLKIDFTEVLPGACLHNPKKTRFEAMREIYRLYREVMGDDIYFLAGGVGCSGHRTTVGVVDFSRIGGDSTAVWEGAWGIGEAIRAVLFRQAMHGIWWTNDPDVTYLKPCRNLSSDEARTWHSTVGLSCGTAGISELLGREDYRDVYRSLETLTPPAHEKTRAFDLGRSEYPERFGFKLTRAWGDAAVVMLWNSGTRPRRIDLAFKEVGLCGDGDCHLWSYWDERYLHTAKKQWRSPLLAPRSCMVIRITEAGLRPVIIGSNLHLSCGAAELADFVVSPDLIRVQLSEAGAQAGALWLHGDAMPILRQADGCQVTGIEAVSEHVYKINIAFRARSPRQTLVFSRPEA